MNTTGWTRRAAALAIVLVAAAGGTPARAARPRHGGAGDPSGCAGTYLVRRKPLIGGTSSDGDAVVLEVAGPAEGTPPLVTLRSGCATAPATLAAKRGGTLVTADLSQCGAAKGTAHLRLLIDAECRTLKGRLRATRGGGARTRRFSARRDRTLAGGRISGRVSA